MAAQPPGGSLRTLSRNFCSRIIRSAIALTWASDQDPLFKEIFYTQLLPDLKTRNKTALVITHDDRYFHLADRIIKLDYGRIETRQVDGHAPYPELVDRAEVRTPEMEEKPPYLRATV